MKTALRRNFVALYFAVAAALNLGSPLHAHAELPASLLERLATPLMHRALSSSIEGRALTERLLGEGFAWQATQTEWKRISELMVNRIFEEQAVGVADELYLRVLRLEQRFRTEAPRDSALLTGEGQASFDDLALMQRIASEELALRGAGLFERVRGIDPGAGGRIEFAKVSIKTAKTGNLSSARQRFLNEVSSGTAWDRANKVLGELGGRREMTYVLFETSEGKEILHRILDPRAIKLYDLKFAEDVFALLGKVPELRDVTIQLAMRLDQAMSAYEGIRATLGIGSGGKMSTATLKRVAREHLKLSPPTIPGAFNFAPATPNSGSINRLSELGIKPRAHP